MGDGPRDKVSPDEKASIMVWKDRGPEEWQPKAVEKVTQWLKEAFNADVENVNYRQEYAWYKNDVTPQSYSTDLKDSDADYLAEQYAIAVDKDDKDPEEAFSQYGEPIDWNNVETNPVRTQNYMWMWDGDFNARSTELPIPTSDDFETMFGDDGTWSAQGVIQVKGKQVTMVIDSKKPFSFHNDPLEMQKEQNNAKDGGIKWIKTILGLNIDHVKYTHKV